MVRIAADGLDRARRLVGLDRFGLRTTPPAWDGSTPEQPMWQTDKDKLHKHRVDKGIIKPAAGTTAPSKPVLEPLIKLYIKRGCPYCRAAVDLLNERNLAFTLIDYSDDHDLRKAIRGQTGRKTSPHVFIHGKSIGGYDELRALAAGAACDSEFDECVDGLCVGPVMGPLLGGWLTARYAIPENKPSRTACAQMAIDRLVAQYGSLHQLDRLNCKPVINQL
mgnify:CR=1 FL=1